MDGNFLHTLEQINTRHILKNSTANIGTQPWLGARKSTSQADMANLTHANLTHALLETTNRLKEVIDEQDNISTKPQALLIYQVSSFPNNYVSLTIFQMSHQEQLTFISGNKKNKTSQYRETNAAKKKQFAACAGTPKNSWNNNKLLSWAGIDSKTSSTLNSRDKVEQRDLSSTQILHFLVPVQHTQVGVIIFE